jgi:ubiquinone/menaquinone biosynthesis C-methylase UbiE
MVDLIAHEPEDAFTCVELGCGTAALTHAVLARFAAANCVAIDSEPAMLAVARGKLSEHGERARVRQDDVLTCALPGCDLVLSSFMLHHVPLDDLTAFMGRIARALRPGGCLIVLDIMQVGPRWAERVGAQSRRLYRRHVAAAIGAGRTTQEEIDARWEFKRRMKEDGKDVEYSHSADAILDAISAAGFDEAGLVWRMFANTIVVGFVGQ